MEVKAQATSEPEPVRPQEPEPMITPTPQKPEIEPKPSSSQTENKNSSPPRKLGPIDIQRSLAKRETSTNRASLAASFKRRQTISFRDKTALLRSVSAMFDAGVPLFAIFSFLSQEGENPNVRESCRRISGSLAAGKTLTLALVGEPYLFDSKSLRLVEAGLRGGQLSLIFAQLADEEEHKWKQANKIFTQLAYPLLLTACTLLAVLVLPPLLLTDLLNQIVAITSKPPLLTQFLLSISSALASPITWTAVALITLILIYVARRGHFTHVLEALEPEVARMPAIGPLWRGLVGIRFLRVFSMSHRAGLSVIHCLELATASTDSPYAVRLFPHMKQTILDGGTLTETFQTGDFLPQIAIEAMAAGESVGQVSSLLESACRVLEAELESRIENVTKLLEPLILALLGVIVGVFVLGCLLPIVELTSQL